MTILAMSFAVGNFSSEADDNWRHTARICLILAPMSVVAGAVRTRLSNGKQWEATVTLVIAAVLIAYIGASRR